MMERLEQAFLKRGVPGDFKKYQKLFDAHLEDPGTIRNFEYFCVPDSDEMIRFYTSIWTGQMADAMMGLHGEGCDLKGNLRKLPENEAWKQMITYEGIAVNERIKAESVAETLHELAGEADGDTLRVVSFGGGKHPERFYDLPDESQIDWVNFETDGSVTDENAHCRVIHDNLLNAATYQDLREVTDLVPMHGVSMYLGKSKAAMANALSNGRILLRKNGIMMFDYLLMTEGMKRTATAQHWPHAQEMKIFETPDEAIREGRETVALVNNGSVDAFLDVERINVTMVEPWGPTSVRFRVRKYSH